MHLHIPTFFQQGDVAPQKQKRSLKSVSQKMATMTKVDMNKKEVQAISQLNNGMYVWLKYLPSIYYILTGLQYTTHCQSKYPKCPQADSLYLLGLCRFVPACAACADYPVQYENFGLTKILY